jgi:hypothetical protein
MACLELDKEIDTVKYKTVQFPARSGLAIKTRLVKFIGPILDGFGKDVGGDMSISLSIFTSKLDDATFVQLILDLLTRTYRNGKMISPESFDIDFAGEYIHLYKVVIFVIESNCFFGKGNIAEVLKSLGQKASQILPATSTVA